MFRISTRKSVLIFLAWIALFSLTPFLFGQEKKKDKNGAEQLPKPKKDDDGDDKKDKDN